MVDRRFTLREFEGKEAPPNVVKSLSPYVNVVKACCVSCVAMDSLRVTDYVVELHPIQPDNLIFECIAPGNALADDRAIFSNAVNELKNASDAHTPPMKPTAGDLDALTRKLILHHAEYTTPRQVSDDASPEEIEEDNARRLNALTTRKRLVLRTWPRDPSGKPITPDNACLGKMTSNREQLWGATIWDFYNVRRFPEVASYITTSTGSRLAKWMKKQGELEWAKEEIEWAEREEDPKEVFPFDIAVLIKDTESVFGAGSESYTKWRNKRKLPPTSLFEPGVYPPRFPKTPFDDLRRPPTLEQRLPLHLLPKKLIVHDPWYLLCVCSYTEKAWDKTYAWGSKDDVMHIYKLELSAAGRKRMKKDEEAAQREHQNLKENPDGLKGHKDLPHGFLLLPTGPIVPDEPIEPLIYVVHDPAPPREPPAEAHLYISPAHTAGVGNHSVVYHAEWELPRSLFVPEILCQQCVMEDVRRIVYEEDSEDGKKRAPQWKKKSGKWVQYSLLKKELTMEIVHANADGTAPPAGGDDADLYVVSPGERMTSLEYEGPLRFIKTRVKHQSLERGRYCAHLEKADLDDHPLTVRLRVAAKLSQQHDEHLAKEAENYQAFPRHFFEHWNGFNIVNPLHEPTPVGALVPQFYGYYVPTNDEWAPLPGDKEKENDERVSKEGGQGRENEGPQAECETSKDDGDNYKVSSIPWKNDKIEGDKGWVDGENNDVYSDRTEEENTDNKSDEQSEPERTPSTPPRRPTYLSPILLIEECGYQITPDQLSIDDRNECASLIYRFHNAGWSHGSVYPRNILLKTGPITDFPLSRMVNGMQKDALRGHQFTFRLIDFGRSRGPWKESEDRAQEKTAIAKLMLMDILDFGDGLL